MKKRRAKPGDWLVECAVSGRTLYASKAVKRWDGKWVHPDYWEPRHPADLYRPDMREEPPAFIQPPNTDTYGVDPSTDWVDTSADDPDTTSTFDGSL